MLLIILMKVPMLEHPVFGQTVSQPYIEADQPNTSSEAWIVILKNEYHSLWLVIGAVDWSQNCNYLGYIYNISDTYNINIHQINQNIQYISYIQYIRYIWYISYIKYIQYIQYYIYTICHIHNTYQIYPINQMLGMIIRNLNKVNGYNTLKKFTNWMLVGF